MQNYSLKYRGNEEIEDIFYRKEEFDSEYVCSFDSVSFF